MPLFAVPEAYFALCFPEVPKYYDDQSTPIECILVKLVSGLTYPIHGRSGR